MKKTLLLFCYLTAVMPLWSQDIKTAITDVTVFQNGAQVTRRGTVGLTAGEHNLRVKNVSPMLRKESIQVKGEGAFTILSVNYQSGFNEEKNDQAQIRELEVRKKELENGIQELGEQVSVMEGEERMINSLHQLSSQHYNNVVEMVVKARQVIQTQLSELKLRQVKVSRELDEKRQKLQQTTQELAARRIPKTTPYSDIVVRVKADRETKADISILYVVNNARWYPAYDLRVNSVSEPLKIEYRASISQQTGEDWNQVKIRLSTTDPSLSGEKPKMQKWNLVLGQNYVQPRPNNQQQFTDMAQTRLSGMITDEFGEALPFANIMAVGSTVGVASDENGYYSMNLPAGVHQVTVSYLGFETVTLNITGEKLNVVMRENAAELQSVEVVAYHDPLIKTEASGAVITRENIVRMPARHVNAIAGTTGDVSKGRNKKLSASSSVPLVVTPLENIVSTEFVIEETCSVPSDTRFYTLSIQNIEIPALYQYYCAPRLDRDVFLTAQLVNWEAYNLLEGQANVFFEGTYVGSTLMDVRYLTDTLNISLGRDKSVIVERKKSKELNKRKMFGNDMVAFRDWDIQVRNNKQQAINLILEDQFPMSADSRIEVKQEEKSGGRLDPQTGIVTWVMHLQQKENKQVKLRYSVKYPASSFPGLD